LVPSRDAGMPRIAAVTENAAGEYLMGRLINFNVVALKDGIGRHVHRRSEVLGALCVLRASASKSV
jgi:hypothetical protein